MIQLFRCLSSNSPVAVYTKNWLYTHDANYIQRHIPKCAHSHTFIYFNSNGTFNVNQILRRHCVFALTQFYGDARYVRCIPMPTNLGLFDTLGTALFNQQPICNYTLTVSQILHITQT